MNVDAGTFIHEVQELQVKNFAVKLIREKSSPNIFYYSIQKTIL